ncbi:MAG: SHOCT domain-containing protein [Alkalibacterium gilvum]|uniref:Putative membrane protein n=1 Tax=Alkalibacterium gilvum TaxID=1130080 RepID=A0A1H6SV03_9LACT|nr:hypothetical protein [Alkalibacterium gilvum]MDN6291022.1 hypothetical protein [Tetragenococcus koreensis]SEI71743.1 putative membrane protein [Alkalibacterium gilvum]
MHGDWGNGFNNMMNFGYENSWWFMLYDGLKFLIIIGAVIFIARMLMNHSNYDAVDILKERYARGEILEEEYYYKLDKLNE